MSRPSILTRVSGEYGSKRAGSHQFVVAAVISVIAVVVGLAPVAAMVGYVTGVSAPTLLVRSASLGQPLLAGAAAGLVLSVFRPARWRGAVVLALLVAAGGYLSLLGSLDFGAAMEGEHFGWFSWTDLQVAALGCFLLASVVAVKVFRRGRVPRGRATDAGALTGALGTGLLAWFLELTLAAGPLFIAMAAAIALFAHRDERRSTRS